MKAFLFLTVISLFSMVSVCGLRAEDRHAIRARMDQRLPQVENLKRQGVVGENNRGFLEVRGSAGSAASVVADENRDREEVYKVLADETGASASQVGKARARQLAQRARAGEWIQDENGNWKQK